MREEEGESQDGAANTVRVRGRGNESEGGNLKNGAAAQSGIQRPSIRKFQHMERKD